MTSRGASRPGTRRIVSLLVAAIALCAGAWYAVDRAMRNDPLAAIVAPFDAPSSDHDGDEIVAPQSVDLSVSEAGSERVLPPKPGVRGRLIDAETGAPIAHWKVCMITPKNAPSTELADILRARLQLPPGAEVQVSADGASFVLGLTDQLATVRTVESPDAHRTALDKEIELANNAIQHGRTLPPGLSVRYAHESGAQVAAPIAAGASDEQQQLPNAVQPTAMDELRGHHALADFAFRTVRIKLAVDGSSDASGGSEEVPSSVFHTIVSNAVDEQSLRVRPGEVLRHLRVAGSGSDLAETTTDDDGRFEFPCPDSDGGSLLLDTPEHVDVTPSHWPLGPSNSACITEITWKVTVKHTGFLRGRVLDADTKKPVAGLGVGVRATELDLHHGGARWDIVTDAQGEFATPFTLQVGRVELLFADGADQEFAVGREEIEFTAPEDDSGSRIDFLVHAGPTFRFLPRLTGDEIQGDLALRFVNLVPAHLAPGAPNPLAQWHADDLHKEDCVWFRGPSSVRREHDGPVYAEWTATDGLVFGRVEIPSIAPVDPNPLPVAFTISASVHGTVSVHRTVSVPASERSALGHTNAERNDEVEGALVRVLDARGAVLGEWTTDEMGQYLIPGLEASRAATIEARHPRLGAASAPIALQNGEPAQVDLKLK
jgi:hypothetical protein